MSLVSACLPYGTPRRKGKPALNEKCDNAGPVFEDVTDRDFVDHIMVSNVPNNKRECMHQRKKHEGICDPPMKDLQLLMCDSGGQSDPT